MPATYLLFTVGGWLGWFLGGCDGLLYALLLFVVLDYLSGVACAIADHKLSSEVSFKGLFRKVLIFSLVGIGQRWTRRSSDQGMSSERQ